MKWLRYNLWKTKRQLNPSAVFRSQLEKKLAQAWRQKYPSAVSWYRLRLMRLASAGTAGLVVAASFGTGAYAYVSPAVTEQSALYPIKQKLEALEESVLNRTPEAKVKFYLKQIARREAEQNVLERNGRMSEVLEERLEKTEEKLVAVRNQLVVAATERQLALEAKIEARLAARRERLERQAVKLTEQLAVSEQNDRNEPAAMLAATLASTTAPERAARSALRQEKIQVRLKVIQNKLEQLPNSTVSATIFLSTSTKPAAPLQIEKIQSRLNKVRTNLEVLQTSTPVVSSSIDFLRPIRRLQQIKDQLEHRIKQLDEHLDSRLEKFNEVVPKREGRPPLQGVADLSASSSQPD